MTKSSGGGTCRIVIWLLSVAVGAWISWVLIADYAQDPIQSAVIGALVMLVLGLLSRRLFCRGGSRVRTRLAEATAREREVSRKPSGKSKPASQGKKTDTGRSALDATMADIKATVEAELANEAQARQKPRPVVAPVAAVPILETTLDEMIDEAQSPEQTGDPVDVPDDASNPTASWDAEEEAEFQALIADADEAAQLTETPEMDAPIPEPESQPEPTPPPMPAPETEPAGKAEPKPETAPAPPPAAPKPVDAPKTEAEPEPKPAPAPEAEAEPEPKPAPAPEVEAEPEPKPAPAPEAQTASEPEIEPMEPRGLDAPEGDPDDLKQIDGIGASEAEALNRAGIFHFTQFVGMNRRELAWIDQNIADEPAAEAWRKQAIQLTRKSK